MCMLADVYTHVKLVLSLAESMDHPNVVQQHVSRFKFDLLISSVVTVAHEKVYEVTYADH